MNILFILKKYKAIIYSTSVYSLFLYEMTGLHKRNETLFVFSQSFARFVKDKYPDSFIIGPKWFFRGPLLSYGIPLFIWCLSKRYGNIPVYVTGGTIFSRLFQHFFSNIIFVEDGVGNYLLGKSGEAPLPKQKTRHRFTNPMYPHLGLDKKVKKIYLTGFLPTPEVIAHKVELVSLQELWDKKTVEQRQAICDAYLPANWESILASDREVLLLTQPWSEDCSTFPKKNFEETDKIELYKKILETYDEKTIIIKTHPREKTNYRTYFPDALVIDTVTPMELLTLMGFTIKKAITVNSSSIHTLNKSIQKIILGTEVTPQLKNETERRRAGYNKDVKFQDDSLVEKYDKGATLDQINHEFK